MPEPRTSTLDAKQQQIAGNALRATVIDLIDLSLITKQARWNVIERDLGPIQPALDELLSVVRRFTDAATERAAALGFSNDGQVVTVVEDSGALALPDGWQLGNAVVEAIVDNLAIVIARLRGRTNATGTKDPVTRDLLVGIAARLEQLRWMWQAQLAMAA
ncbi:MAG: starvation/stationary phase protection protein [Nocardia sp.]|uniref:Dps family protein n=1 Tax=Nocardia sp. TaxID=1821 RepID=UPI00262770F0|nr:ferritin-like domain-containing protein [Nocardia sp.]MCU1642410.1 starvation/stationary phase protection protein [Nocardia sp.]